MTYTYIKFENQTYGEKAKNILSKHGIRSRLKRNPNPNRKDGCNYALFVDGNVFNAFNIISDNNIMNLGVESFRDRE